MAMIRKQLYLADEQQRKIRRIAARRGCTEAEIVREAIDRLPEFDDPVTRRLAEAGALVFPYDEDDDLPTEAEAEEIEREIAQWADEHGPIGLSQAVWEDREGR